MKSLLALAAGTLAMFGLAAPAHAINCSKASTAVEHLICGDRTLQNADAAMGKAYEAIVKSTDDAEIRAMLVASQKRWLNKRDLRLGQIFDPDASAEKASKAELQHNLLAAMADRTAALTARSKTDPHVAQLIAVALGQRKFAAQYTGGPYAGVDSDCDFMPGTPMDRGPYGYSCFATRSYQNHDRVCTTSTDWATYRVYETHTVATVVGNHLKTIATCSVDGGGCPDPDAPNDPANWDRNPKNADVVIDPAGAPLSKVDGDAGPDDDDPWLHACLTDSTYPPAAPASGGSPKHD